jgi:hypothetical protein
MPLLLDSLSRLPSVPLFVNFLDRASFFLYIWRKYGKELGFRRVYLL